MSKMSKVVAALGVVAGLGVAALPLSSYAVAGVTDTANTTAQAIVGDSIEITVDDATVTMNNVMANQDINSTPTNITVKTNNVSGYQVQIEDADAETALKTTDGSGTATGIPAGKPVKGTNAWGFKTSSSSANVNISSDAADYRAVDAKGSPKIIATGAAQSANDGDVIALTFGVTVDSTIAAGTYQDEVTLTATTK